MKLFSIFRGAGATGHVFLMKKGKRIDKGLAFGGVIGMLTTVAVVPTTPRVISFAIKAQTKDLQSVTVNGNVTVTLVPGIAASRFDFTVDSASGGYLGDWLDILKAKVVERVLRTVLVKVKDFDVSDVVRAQPLIEDAVKELLGNDVFSEEGVSVTSCSVPSIDPADRDVAAALGATQRELILTGADQARQDRRLKGVEAEEAIKTREAQAALALEEQRTQLLEKKGSNELLQARTDAEASKLRLEPLERLDRNKLFGMSLVLAAQSGSLTDLTIGSDVVALMKGEGN